MSNVIERSKLDHFLEKYTECSHKRNDNIDPECIHCNMAWVIERIKVLEFEQQKQEYKEKGALIEKIRDVSPNIIGNFLGNRIVDVIAEEGYCKLPAVGEFMGDMASILREYQRKGMFDNLFEKFPARLMADITLEVLKKIKNR